MMPPLLTRIVRSRLLAAAVTVIILVLLFRRIPLERLAGALEQADYGLFFAAMIPNTLFYFCWDTLVLTTVVRWFHGPVRYRDLLPARAASYVVAFFNTNAGRGALAAFLSRRLSSPFLQLGSTVLFLVLTEYVHLVAWATLGMLRIWSEVPRQLLWVPPGIAVLWLVIFVYARAGGPVSSGRSGASRGDQAADAHVPRPGSAPAGRATGWVFTPRDWALFRTFRLAPAHRYLQVILLRAPMFFVSMCLHFIAARAFGLHIPFVVLLAFLPIVFMIAALPITVARLGTTQAAWLFFFSPYADPPTLLAFSLAAHLTFVVTRSAIGLVFLPRAYSDLVGGVSRRTAGPAPAGSGR